MFFWPIRFDSKLNSWSEVTCFFLMLVFAHNLVPESHRTKLLGNPSYCSIHHRILFSLIFFCVCTWKKNTAIFINNFFPRESSTVFDRWISLHITFVLSPFMGFGHLTMFINVCFWVQQSKSEISNCRSAFSINIHAHNFLCEGGVKGCDKKRQKTQSCDQNDTFFFIHLWQRELILAVQMKYVEAFTKRLRLGHQELSQQDILNNTLKPVSECVKQVAFKVKSDQKTAEIF